MIREALINVIHGLCDDQGGGGVTFAGGLCGGRRLGQGVTAPQARRPGQRGDNFTRSALPLSGTSFV